MKYCQNCGSQLKDGANFCPECGTRAAAVPAFEEEKPKSRVLAIILIILAVLAVLAIAIGTLFFLFSYKPAPAADVAPPLEIIENAGPADEEKSAESTLQEEAPAETAEAPEIIEAPAEAPVPAGPLHYGTPDEQFAGVQKGIFGEDAAQAFTGIAEKEGPELDTDLKLKFKIKDAPAIINSSSANISVRVDSEGTSVIDVNFKMGGFFGISGLITYGDETFGIKLFDKYYTVTLEELVKMAAAEAGISPEEFTVVSGGRIDSAVAAQELSGIPDILFKLATPENTVRKDGTVELEYVNGSADCARLSCTPTAQQIESTIIELCDYLQGSEIMKLMEQNSDFPEALAEIRAQAGETAQRLAEQNFTWSVSCDDDRIYEVSIGPEGEEIVFQNLTGEESGVTVLAGRGSSGGIACKNEYTIADGRISGRFELAEFVIVYDLSLENRSALGVPYGDVSVMVAGDTLKFNTRAGSKSGSVHTLVYVDDEEGELFTVSLESSDKPASVELPDIPATEVNSENFEEVLGDLESIFEMFN